MTIVVRRLGPGDEGVLEQLALEAAAFDLAGRTAQNVPLAPADASAYLADPGLVHWVAEEDGRVVGELLCHVLRLPHGAGRELLLYAIGVRETHRRRGAGRALVDVMRAFCESAGIPEVWVLADNSGAERFYGACGFRRGGEDEQGVLMLLDVV